MAKFLVTRRPHYFNNRMVQPGGVIDIPDADDPAKQIKPGKLLVPYTAKAKAELAKDK